MDNPKHIPDELIMTKILPRLPVKSLKRFKSVSKHWDSTISSSSFVKSHVECSGSRPQIFLQIEKSGNYYGCLLSEDDVAGVQASSELPTFSHDCPDVPKHWEIAGCCDGLICLFWNIRHYDHSYEPRPQVYKIPTFHIWNPAIHECIDISCPTQLDDIEDAEDAGHSLACGFGYASSLDDYKVALLYESRNKKFIQIYMFSLRDGVWKRKSRVPRIADCYVDFEAVSINDTLYWLVRGSNQKRILMLNLVTEQVEVIPLPMMMINCKFLGYDSSLKLFVLKGRLSICRRSQRTGKQPVYDVWTVKENSHDLSFSTSWDQLWSDVDFEGGFLRKISVTGRCLVSHFSRSLEGKQENRHVVCDFNSRESCKQSSGISIDFQDSFIRSTCCYTDSLIPLPKIANSDDDDDDDDDEDEDDEGEINR